MDAVHLWHCVFNCRIRLGDSEMNGNPALGFAQLQAFGWLPRNGFAGGAITNQGGFEVFDERLQDVAFAAAGGGDLRQGRDAGMDHAFVVG